MPVVVSGAYASLGFGTFSVGASTAVSIWNGTAASGANVQTAQGTTNANRVMRVILSCPGGNLRWSAGGGTPTSSTFHKLVAGNVLQLDVDPRSFSMISESGTVTVYCDYQGE